MKCNKGQDLVAIASATAIAIADGKTPEELGLLGNLFNLIGDALSVMAAKQDLCSSLSSNSNSNATSNAGAY